MLSNDQLYVLECLRSSLGRKEKPDDSAIENEKQVAGIILKNSILLTVYKHLSPSIQDLLKLQYISAIKQSITQDYEGKRIVQKVTEKGFTCIGLKGWENRKLYPEFTMRQMSDVDFLIWPYDYSEIKRIMLDLGFNSGKRESANKNDTFRKNTVSVETHKRITESPEPNILEWEKGLIDRSDGVHLSSEDFYIHHIIHLHHDFGNGSLGLRRIADTWLLQKTEMDKEKVDAVLEKLNLRVFNDRMVRLCKACLGEDSMDEQSEYLIQHACKYGIFGTEKSYKTARVVTRGKIKKGKFAALRDAVFMPYENMKVLYPQLEKHPVLLPFCWAKRLLLKSSKLKRNIKKMDYSVVTDDSYEEIERFFAVGGYNTQTEGKSRRRFLDD